MFDKIRSMFAKNHIRRSMLEAAASVETGARFLQVYAKTLRDPRAVDLVNAFYSDQQIGEAFDRIMVRLEDMGNAPVLHNLKQEIEKLTQNDDVDFGSFTNEFDTSFLEPDGPESKDCGYIRPTK